MQQRHASASHWKSDAHAICACCVFFYIWTCVPSQEPDRHVIARGASGAVPSSRYELRSASEGFCVSVSPVHHHVDAHLCVFVCV